MTQITPTAPVPICPTPRRSMGRDRRRRIHIARKGKCAFCGRPCERFGPSTIYDHIIPLALGGADENHNVQLLHAEPCDRLKTARDKRHIAKAKRLIAREDGTRRVRRAIPSTVKPWPAKGTRKLAGRSFQRKPK